MHNLIISDTLQKKTCYIISYSLREIPHDPDKAFISFTIQASQIHSIKNMESLRETFYG